VRNGTWINQEIEYLNEVQLLTAKPIIYLVNMGKENFETQKNKWLKDIIEWAKKRSPGAAVIPFSAPFEMEVSKMEEAKKKRIFGRKKSSLDASKNYNNRLFDS